MTGSNAASQLASMRRIVSHTCPVCETEFEGLKRAVYCSEACKQRAKYQRKKAADADAAEG